MKFAGIISALLAFAAFAQESPYQAYAAQIEALQRDGANIAHQYGRDVLIDKYRDLIDAHPDFPNNIQLETQIAMLYESDFADRGEPPNLQAAYETYQRIIETYDADHPYMPTVRTYAADRATELDPDAAREMYLSMIKDYPEDDALVVQSHYSLGKLAEQQGDSLSAQLHFNTILNYKPSGAPLSQSQLASIEAYQANAAASTLAAVLEQHDTPQDRAKALKKYVEKHQELMSAHADLVQRFSKSIESSARNAASVEDADALSFSLNKGKKKRQDSPARKDDRTRVRELRARDADQREREKLAQAVARIMPPTRQSNPSEQAGVLSTAPNSGSATHVASTVVFGATAATLVLASIAFVFMNRVKR